MKHRNEHLKYHAGSSGASGDFGDSIMTVKQFGYRYPHIYPKLSRIRWLLRDRHTNGLIEHGAVIEVYANGDKPCLYIHAPSWFEWMKAGGRRSAA